MSKEEIRSSTQVAVLARLRRLGWEILSKDIGRLPKDTALRYNLHHGEFAEHLIESGSKAGPVPITGTCR